MQGPHQENTRKPVRREHFLEGKEDINPKERTRGGIHFALNLGQDDSNLAIHFNARFEALGDVKQIVCNSRSNGQWGAEVRPSIFPFQEGAEIKIKVKIDGQEISFPNRLGLNSAQYFSVDGDISILSFKF
uniref:Galectin n=1 Tax=Pseudonaja textilis TaxID=8673 RepID=A0A670ZJ62_PSETE